MKELDDITNFGAATLKGGLHRVVNNLKPSASPRLRVKQSVREKMQLSD